MKHYLPNSLRALFLSLAVLLSLPMLAHHFEMGRIYYNILSSEERTVEVTFYGSNYNTQTNEYSGHVTIPESVTYSGITYSVVAINSNTFLMCQDVTGVTIPRTIERIGVGAFGVNEAETEFTTLRISDLEAWCNIDFEASSSNPMDHAEYIYLNDILISDLAIPEGVKEIGAYAFYDCDGLTSVTIPNSVTSIGSSAFQYCSGLTSVTIGNGVKSIGSGAFWGCSNLLDVYCYAENVPYTDDNAFYSLPIEKATLHVPAASIESYKATEPWSSFKNIVAITTEVDGINYDFNAGTKQATVIAKSSGKYSDEVVIPESVKYEGTTYSVTRIMEKAFYQCSGLTSITIPNSVTSIGDWAFSGCTGLTSVTIGNSVTSIGDFAFNSCTGLTSVTIPNSVTSIGEMAFDYCSGLTSVTIGNSVTSIGDYAFENCFGLTSVTIPNSVTIIGLGAFEGCSGLTSITIPNSVTRIERNTFSGCSGLTSVTIPNSVTSIGDFAFSGCPELLNVYCYAENVPSTESNVFNGIDGEKATLYVPAASIDSYKAKSPWSGFGKIVAISTEVDGINYDFNAETKQATVIAKSSGEYSGEVVIPESVEHEGTAYSVTSIGEKAFWSCDGLTSVTIPNNVTSIGGAAFYGCSGLTSVTIGNSVTSIGNSAFDGCSGLTSVTIPNSVVSIGEFAFYSCSGLTSVIIPNSVTSIGERAFCNCIDLTSIVVEDENPVYDSRNNCNAIIETATNTLHSGCKTTIIPNSVTSIGNFAFYYCEGLTSVTIPNSVTSIGEGAFDGCSGLTSVTIGNSVTSIGGVAFWCCYGLTSVTIPNNVTSIGDGAFEDCYGLTSVTIGNSVESIGREAFCNCSGLTSVTIPNSVTSIGGWAFGNCSGLTSVTIPNSVTSIGEYAFAHCSELLDVYCYAEKVPSTKSNAFDGSYPKNPTLHVPAASIESYKATEPWSGFGKIVAITTEVDGINYDFNAEAKQATVIAKSSGKYSGEVIIPESVEYGGTTYSVTSIGNEAFYGCSGLTSVTIPNSVTSIESRAFSYCSYLTTIKVDENNPIYDSRDNCNAIIETASNTLIQGCKTTTIPNSVTSIGEYAFEGCSGLTSATIGNSVESIGHAAFAYCSGLTSVTIGNSVRSIENFAFYGCSGLTSVTIPNSVTSIGDYAFCGCSGLTSVIVPNSVTNIGYGAFRDCSGLTSVTIGSGVKTIGLESFANCPELLDVYCYAEKVPSTSSDAFEYLPLADATLHVPAVSMNSYKVSEPWSGFGKIVAISESTSDLVIKDGESFENTEERELGTLTYTRTLPNMLWNPLYVPFKIPYEALKDNYDVAYINSMHSYDNDQNGEIDKMTMEVILVKNGVLKANHPYLIRAKSENDTKMELVLEDVTLYPTVSNKLDCSSVYTRFEITGTYKKMYRADLNGSLVITTSGAWMELSESSELKPFRFYLTITDRPGSPLEVSKESKSRINICVQGEDDFSTGIEETEIGKVNSENSAVYDLSGRRVQKAQKGIYIRDGKVVVK